MNALNVKENLCEVKPKLKVYFGPSQIDLPSEKAKIDCGKAHFAALGNDTQFIKADSYDSFDSQIA